MKNLIIEESVQFMKSRNIREWVSRRSQWQARDFLVFLAKPLPYSGEKFVYFLVFSRYENIFLLKRQIQWILYLLFENTAYNTYCKV